MRKGPRRRPLSVSGCRPGMKSFFIIKTVCPSRSHLLPESLATRKTDCEYSALFRCTARPPPPPLCCRCAAPRLGVGGGKRTYEAVLRSGPASWPTCTESLSCVSCVGCRKYVLLPKQRGGAGERRPGGGGEFAEPPVPRRVTTAVTAPPLCRLQRLGGTYKMVLGSCPVRPCV